MKCLSFLLLILSGCLNPLHAEDPLMLGLRGALNTLASVPDATASAAGKATTQLLRPYLRPGRGTFYAQVDGGSTSQWIEIKGLRFSRFTLGVVSQADQANGISERLIVSLESDMHRSQAVAGGWGEWKNGSPGFLPTAIQMDRRNGVWSGSSSMLRLLRQVNDSPIIIPGLPEGSPPPSNVAPRIVPPQPIPAGTPSAATPSQGVQASSHQLQVDFWKQIHSSLTSGFGTFVILILVGILLLKWMKFPTARKRGRLSTPTPSLRTAPSAPPPLPSAPRDFSSNPVDLIKRCETLMTPAELQFFKVLDPLVGLDCMISAKVRLADVFDAKPGPNQQAAFNMIVGKHLDFVFSHRSTSRILCAVELDDHSHLRPDRQERDRFVNEIFAANQLPLIRIPVRPTYDPEQLRELLSQVGIPVTEILAPAQTGPAADRR